MKKFDFKKHMTKFVIILLCIFFVGGVFWGANNVLEMEGTQEPYVVANSISPLPKTQREMIDYVSAAVERAGRELPKVDAGEDVGIDDVTFSSQTPAITAAADYIKGSLCESLEDDRSDFCADYGEANTLPALDIDTKDLLFAAQGDSFYRCSECGAAADRQLTVCPKCEAENAYALTPAAECRYVYYQCPICEEKVDEKPKVCPECGGTEEFLLRYSDEYQFTFFVNPDSQSFADAFPCRTQSEIDKIAADGCKGVCECENITVKCTAARLVVKVNRITDKIVGIELFRDMTVSTGATFVGAYAKLDSQTVSFAVSDKIYYDFSWPQLELSEEKMTVEPKGSESLKATLTCDDPAKHEVKWSSSDESIAAVDEDGYVTGGKKVGSAVITAEFVFQGKTYSDTCEVFVRTPVESIDISKRSLEMKVGDTFKIEATVSPRKASVKTVRWYSDDEKIAEVDENGVVTAVGEGKVNVYALSDDGYYRATCKLEVTK